MIDYYLITEEKGVKTSGKTQSNFIVLEKSTKLEEEELVKQFELPSEIFRGGDEAEEISRVEKLPSEKLGELTILSLTNLSNQPELTIEKRLEPLIFITSKELTLVYVGDNSDFMKSFFEKYQEKVTSFEKLIGYVVLMIYGHYINELLAIKKEIDRLDEAARRTTENTELFRLADTERDVVYLDHTLRGQMRTLNYLWEETEFVEKLGDPQLLYNIKLRQMHAEELISIYRDLLETVGGLFSDMMDNNLNHLMKYLDSAALIISIPALVSGIWGMNTGGLPGKGSSLGFFIVLILAFLLSLLVAFHLKRKDFSKS